MTDAIRKDFQRVLVVLSELLTCQVRIVERLRMISSREKEGANNEGIRGGIHEGILLIEISHHDLSFSSTIMGHWRYD